MACLKRRMGWALVCMALCLLFIPGAQAMDWTVGGEEESLPPDPQQQARYFIREMTLEQKIYQLFFVAPEALTGETYTFEIQDISVMRRYPVGGVVLFGQNIVSETQLKALTAALRLGGEKYGGIPPFIAVDEEGGSVSRIANKLGYSLTLSPEEIGQRKDAASAAYAAGEQIAAYLTPLGINMDFAPVADVLVKTVEELKGRSYGSDAQIVADCALSMAEALRQGGVIPCFKHFPGHGAVSGNSHRRMVTSRRTLAEMQAFELIPFERAIAEGTEAIMTSHLIAKGLGDEVPASMSPKVIESLLREQMEYDGLVICDALRMNAVTQAYKENTAAVRMIQAGADMILLPQNMESVAASILHAVQNGEISEERIDESVARILGVKIQAGLLTW